MSFWNSLELQRKSANVVRVPRKGNQSAGKLSEWRVFSLLYSGPNFFLHSPGMDSTSDADGPESEEDDVEENPYPLEGKYVDEYDRQRYATTFTPSASRPAEELADSWKCLRLNAKRSLRNALKNSNA
jgi:hypothetical protein